MHCYGLLRTRSERPRHRAPNRFDEIATPHASPSLGSRPYSAFNSGDQSTKLRAAKYGSMVYFPKQQFRAGHVS
jgi:hypothetical protein